MGWDLLLQITFFAGGLFLLLKSADFFVDAGSGLAKVLGISELVVGLTIVSVGTSLPELAASVSGALRGEVGLAAGNVIGSNFANMGLVLGVTVLIRRVTSEPVMVYRDGLSMLLLTALLCGLLWLGDLGRVAGMTLLLFVVLFTVFLIRDCRYNPPGTHAMRFLIWVASLGFLRSPGERPPAEEEPEEGEEGPRSSVGRLILELTASLVGVVVGGFLFVDAALWLAVQIGATGGAIGVTVVALATSFPELIVSCKAALRGYGAIAIGNVIGSNIANIGLVLGITSLITPVPASTGVRTIAAPLLLGFTAFCVFFLRTRWQMRRWEGAVLVLLYLAVVPLVASHL